MATDKYQILDDPLTKAIQNACKSMAPPEIVLSDCVLPKNFLNYYKAIQDMEVRPDDIWVVSFPKCGTTWTQEMVWLLKHKIDTNASKSTELYKRFPFLDFTGLWPEEIVKSKNIGDSVKFVEEMPSPRLIKSHLPPSLLPKQIFEVKPKIIYVHRNPKDASVSYYHHFRLWNDYTGSLEDFLEAYVQDKHVFSPFWEHNISYWNLRKTENILILSFEDMKKNLAKEMRKTAEFLDVEYTEEEERQLLEHLSFDSMKNNDMVNFQAEIKEMGKNGLAFIRKGQVNSYKEEMSPEMCEKFDAWSHKKLEGSDFPSYVTKCDL